MAKKWLHLHHKTPTASFFFEVLEDPAHLDHWRAHGVEIDEIVNTIPVWLPNWIPARWWCAAQDAFNFKWPWGKA